MADCAAAGECVLLFPEGKLTLDGATQEIKGGYELVARRASCPVVMVHLDGLWGSIFSFEGGKWFFKWPRALAARCEGGLLASDAGGGGDAGAAAGVLERARGQALSMPGMCDGERGRGVNLEFQMPP